MKRTLAILILCALPILAGADDLWILVKQSRWTAIETVAEERFARFCDGTQTKVFSFKWILQDGDGATWGYARFGGGAWVLKRSGEPITPDNLAAWYNTLSTQVKKEVKYTWGGEAEFAALLTGTGLERKPAEPAP